MNSIPKRILISSGALIALLLALNLWLWPNQELQQSPTSFGIMRDGYQATFDLLTEMNFPVTRSYRRPKLLAASQTVWFVSPSFLVADKPGAHDDAHEVIEWASRGGTAIISGGPGSNWKVLGLMRTTEPGPERTLIEEERTLIEKDRSLVEGEHARIPRWLDVADLLHFSAAEKGADDNWRVRLTASGHPFVLEKDVGSNGGRVIAIADDNFLRNEHLADADASLVVVDLVREFGAPTFDEHSHGLAAPTSLPLAILDSRAMLPIVIGLLAAMLWIFSQRAWPMRTLREGSDMPAPSIASFVESLSILYARAGDPAAVFRAYRIGFLRRLRRQIGLRPDYPEDLLLERIARDRSLSAETRRRLIDREAPSDQRELVIAVRAIESYTRQPNETRT
jgi:hypothetical protein